MDHYALFHSALQLCKYVAYRDTEELETLPLNQRCIVLKFSVTIVMALEISLFKQILSRSGNMMGKDEHKGFISEYPTPSYSVKNKEKKVQIVEVKIEISHLIELYEMD